MLDSTVIYGVGYFNFFKIRAELYKQIFGIVLLRICIFYRFMDVAMSGIPDVTVTL
jgi:hypothetical protein